MNKNKKPEFKIQKKNVFKLDIHTVAKIYCPWISLEYFRASRISPLIKSNHRKIRSLASLLTHKTQKCNCYPQKNKFKSIAVYRTGRSRVSQYFIMYFWTSANLLHSKSSWSIISYAFNNRALLVRSMLWFQTLHITK